MRRDGRSVAIGSVLGAAGGLEAIPADLGPGALVEWDHDLYDDRLIDLAAAQADDQRWQAAFARNWRRFCVGIGACVAAFCLYRAWKSVAPEWRPSDDYSYWVGETIVFQDEV